MKNIRNTLLTLGDIYPADEAETISSLEKLGFRIYGRPLRRNLRVPFSLRRTIGGTTRRFGPNQSINLLANKSSLGTPDSIKKLFSDLSDSNHRFALIYQASGYAGSPDILNLAREYGFFLGNCLDITTRRVALNVKILIHEMFSETSGGPSSAVQYYRTSDYIERWKERWTAGKPDETLQAILDKKLPLDCFQGRTFFIIGSRRPRTFGSHLANEIEDLGGQVEFFSVWGNNRANQLSLLFSNLGRADAVLLGTQLTDDTRRLVGRKFMGCMKEGAILASLSRGPMVVESDLLKFASKLRFIIDVADKEPLNKKGGEVLKELLLQSPQSVVTAHSLHLSESTVHELSFQSYCLLAIANGIDKKAFFDKLGLLGEDHPSVDPGIPHDERVSIPSLGWVTNKFLEESWGLVPSNDEPNIFVTKAA